MNENTHLKWTSCWGNAISIATRRPENYARDLTLRYPVRSLLSGNAIRIRIDNFCGNEAVSIRAFAARSDGDSGINADTSLPITFAGSEKVTIPKGGSVLSDPAKMNVRAGEFITISMYLEDFTEMRSAVLITGPLSKGFFAVGDHTCSSVLPDALSNKTNWFYFLSDIEVLTDDKSHAVICYGDSITAGAWPDYLMERTLEISGGKTSIIRKAASGTRILRQYDNITYDSYGLKGSIRFPREIPMVSGADTVIIQHGINDIIHPVGTDVNKFRPWSDLPTADEMIEGLREYIRFARKQGLKVYIGTLLPIEGWRTYADFREKLRDEVNTWIRTTDETDGCIDFDKAVCDSLHPSRFADGYDSGDHLHPSPAAYKAMAQAVQEEIII